MQVVLQGRQRERPASSAAEALGKKQNAEEEDMMDEDEDSWELAEENDKQRLQQKSMARTRRQRGSR